MYCMNLSGSILLTLANKTCPLGPIIVLNAGFSASTNLQTARASFIGSAPSFSASSKHSGLP